MSGPKLISIIMVTCNTGAVLYRAIASVLAQKQALELILVNNGNPPEVEATLVEKFKDVPNVRLMTGHGNIGYVKGRNLGARVATGDYLLFLSDNCILPVEALTLLQQEAQNREEPFILGARLCDPQGKEKEASRLAFLTPCVAFLKNLPLSSFFPKYRASLYQDPLPAQTSPIEALGGDFVFCAKKDFSFYRGFDEKYFMAIAVMDFCMRFSHEGTVYFMPKLNVRQEEGNLSLLTPDAAKSKLKAYARYFVENFADSYPQPVLWVLFLVYGIRLAVDVALKRKVAVS